MHRDLVDPAETTEVDPYGVTTAARTAFDLIRWVPALREKVVSVDAIAFKCRIDPAEVLRLRSWHLGARGARHIVPVLTLSDARAESPMETRIRMALHEHGLPAPHLQFAGRVGGRARRLDLAHPDAKLAIEYDCRAHRSQKQARMDLQREAELVRLGWTVLRFHAHSVYFHPAQIARTVAYELRRRHTLVHSAP